MADLGQPIELPFESERPDYKSDALDDFHIRLDDWVNYVAENILLAHTSDGLTEHGPQETEVKHWGPLGEVEVSTPPIAVKSEDAGSKIARHLYYAAVTQLATIYEIFLNEAAKYSLRKNPEELLAIDEHQISSKEIFELGDITSIREELVDRWVFKFGMLSYPKKVSKYESKLHVGLHSDDAPMSQFEVHDFIEMRHVVIHNGGHATDKYFDRMEKYDEDLLLERSYSTPDLDFTWLFNFARRLTSQCQFIDKEIDSKWGIAYMSED